MFITTEYAEPTVKELRQKAHDLNIKKWYSMKKEDLLKALADFKMKVPDVDVPSKLEKEKDITDVERLTAMEEVTNSRSRSISWIVLIACVITIPLFAWWVSQPDPWYQTILDFFKF